MAIKNQLHGQWKPGQSGNPSGRPKGAKNRSTVLKKWIEMKSTFSDELTGQQITGTIEDRIALGLIGRAIKGDVAAAREILDSVYGREFETQSEGITVVLTGPTPPNE